MTRAFVKNHSIQYRGRGAWSLTRLKVPTTKLSQIYINFDDLEPCVYGIIE